MSRTHQGTSNMRYGGGKEGKLTNSIDTPYNNKSYFFEEVKNIIDQDKGQAIYQHFIPDYQPGSSNSKKYTSPFREEKTPSFTVKQNTGRFKDWGLDVGGSPIDFIKELQNIDFSEACLIAANIYNISIPKEFNSSVSVTINQTKKAVPKKNQLQDHDDTWKIISISFRKEPNKEEIEFWRGKANTEPNIWLKYFKIVDSFILKKGRKTKKEETLSCFFASEVIPDKKYKIYQPRQKYWGDSKTIWLGSSLDSFKGKELETDYSYSLGLEELDSTKPVFLSGGEADFIALKNKEYNVFTMGSEVPTMPRYIQDQLIEKGIDLKDITVVYDTDEAGIKNSQLLSNNLGCQRIEIPGISGAKEENDICDYIKKYGSIDYQLERLFRDAEYKVLGKQKTKIEVVQDFLNDHYQFRLNVISNSIEYKKKGKGWESCNENEIYRQLQLNDIKFGLANLVSLLGSDFVSKHNPFTDYFQELKWDGKDHISRLASYIKTDNPSWLELMLKKWLMRVYRCATEESFCNKQAFVLVHEKQNSGKSTFIRFLCPPVLKNYIAEDIEDGKDGDIALTENLFINLDELAYLSKSEINKYKSRFSATQVKKRRPYGKKSETFQRIASFVGSTNDQEFLKDSTGSVRFLCFNIENIDWNYSKDININQVYAQAVEMVKRGEHNHGEMTSDELNNNEENNEQFKVSTLEKELVEKYFEPDENGIPLSTTEMICEINKFESQEGSKIVLNERNKKAIGSAIKELGFDNKQRKINGKNKRCSFVKYTDKAERIQRVIQTSLL